MGQVGLRHFGDESENLLAVAALQGCDALLVPFWRGFWMAR